MVAQTHIMTASAKPFTFICGPDDFLVNREGKVRYDAIATTITDEFSREILNGMANNVAEVANAVNRLRDSVQTISMFGDRRLIWLKDVNFLTDTLTSRAESTLAQVENLQEILSAVDPAQTAVIITAAPVDKRRSFYKWCEKNADFTLCGGEIFASSNNATEALSAIVAAEAQTLGITFGENALPLLLAKIGPNTRLLIEEVHKLANYLADGVTVIGENHVAELTPNVAEGDFFEAVEAFFSGHVQRTLDALHRHFFNGGDSRPILASLQGRNRLLLQIRALVHAGELRIGSRGIDKASFDKLASTDAYGRHFAGVTEKTNFNLFSQNIWYVSRLVDSGRLPSMRRLIDNQREFINAFEEIISRPKEQEEVLRGMTLRCLGEAA
jgi:DNA polymerase-3 subunit delta